MKNLTILGSTGTIGENTLDVVAMFPDKFSVFALTANKSVEKIFKQIVRWRPKYAVLSSPRSAKLLFEKVKAHSKLNTIVLGGAESIEFVASHDETDYVMAAIVGGAGLLPSLSAARHGKRILLANKESLVMSGELFMNEVKKSGSKLLPIDSEHNAIFQCLPNDYNGLQNPDKKKIRKLILTASGGPFRTVAIEKFKFITVEEACNHPNWVMGRKISVDSATMMNKGLEIIEACHLYSTPSEMVEVVVHPQSIVHSMVEYVDGSVLAQLGTPDMKIPIAYGLGWPDRIDSGSEFLNFYNISQLNFEEPDVEKFKCLNLAREAYQQSGIYPTVLNAANEVAVQSFLDKRVRFSHIPEIIENALHESQYDYDSSIDAILYADTDCRSRIEKKIGANKWSI